MEKIERDEEREERISLEITVDAYDAEEVAMGWYYTLGEKLDYPFEARCINEREISPLKVDEVVQVLGMAPANDCMHDMLVIIRWMDRTFGVPLAQLDPVDDGNVEAVEAIGDWRYWVARGYQLG